MTSETIISDAKLLVNSDEGWQELGVVTDVRIEDNTPSVQELVISIPKRYNFSLTGHLSRRELMRFWGYAKYWHRRN